MYTQVLERVITIDGLVTFSMGLIWSRIFCTMTSRFELVIFDFMYKYGQCITKTICIARGKSERNYDQLCFFLTTFRGCNIYIKLME